MYSNKLEMNLRLCRIFSSFIIARSLARTAKIYSFDMDYAEYFAIRPPLNYELISRSLICCIHTRCHVM